MKKSLINLLKSYKTIWRYQKGWIFFSVMYAIVTGFLPIVILWTTKEFINELTRIISENSNYTYLTLILLIQVFTTITATLMDKIKIYLDQKSEMKLELILKNEFYTKVTESAFENFDDQDYYDSISRVNNAIGPLFLNPFNESINLLKSIISISSILIYLISIDWLLFLLVIIPVIPIFLVEYKYSMKKYQLMYNNTRLVRETDYISRLLIEKNTAKEIKIFNLGHYLINRWSNGYKKNSKMNLNLLKKEHKAELGIEGVKSIFFLAITFFIIKLIQQNKLQIGDYIATLQAVQQTQSLLYQSSKSISGVLESTFYLGDFYNFFENNQKEHQNRNFKKDDLPFPKPFKKGIEIKNLTFSYKGMSNQTLKNISLTINAGEKLAILGENGSGKTTLVKLIMGLYSSSTGDILFDNVSIKNIDPKEIQKNITALFQDFSKFSFSVYDNIGFGKVDELLDKNKIIEYSKITDADKFIKNLKYGYDTPLTRFLQDGEDLSGGQWQKVAYSRALYRDSQVMILDEPTASLDPQSEKKIFEHIDSITDNKTLIFISHRISAAMIADKILVMKNGDICEYGTFEELMDRNGEFKKMYKAQTQHLKQGYILQEV